MATIDIGPGNIVPTLGVIPYTRIERTNPANETGVLTSLFIEVSADVTGLKIGTFDPSTLIVRDFVDIGNLATGEHTISDITCDVVAGDYIGTYFTSGLLASNEAGIGTDAYSGDGFDGNSHSYTFYGGYQVSVGGSGETGAIGILKLGLFTFHG
jgi:hypothetical protein